ncbi:MAG: nucleotidyltransferase domain-containing protein [Candidatus Cloacimonadaceae bacterium]
MNKIKTILDKVVSALSGISGIQAVVLGGSRARGTHSSESDIDIGIYYDKDTLDLMSLNKAAKLVDDEHRDNLVVPPGEWGKWVNGGGWLVIDGYHVDLILRDAERVKNVISECQEGNVSAHYQTGHPHAYMNVMYMGELAVCKMLWDKQGNISALKRVAEQYPPELKRAIIGFFAFEAEFSLMFAESSAEKNDVYYVTAHIVRAISALNQVLFAVNEEYCLNEKKAVGMIDHLNINPLGYKDKVNSIFVVAGTDSTNACAQLKQLINEVKEMLPNNE